MWVFSGVQKDGYHLASIDNLLSNGQEDNYQGAEAEYTYYQSVANSNVPAHLIIQSFENKTDGDLKTMSDKGVFAYHTDYQHRYSRSQRGEVDA